MSDHASTGNTGGSASNSSEHTGLLLLTHGGLGSGTISSRGGSRGRGLSGLLVGRSRSRGSSSGRSGRTRLTGHYEVVLME